MQDHRRLRVWRKAVALALNVRRVVDRYPTRGYSELRGQTVASVESIIFNIIEGCGASTQREFARFLEMAIKSNKELEGQLELASDYEILSHRRWEPLATDTIDVRRMLFGLRKRVLSTPDRPDRPPDPPPDAPRPPEDERPLPS